MKSNALYDQLEKDFVLPGMTDDWTQSMGSLSDLVTPQFKARSIGLVCDFAQHVITVRTAVFPSEKVMANVLDEGIEEAMLFCHHAATWDLRRAPEVFTPIDRNLLEGFKTKKISIYVLHVPLDHYGKYSTSVTLAQSLGIVPEKAFAPYFGGTCGVIGSGKIKSTLELKKTLEGIVGHSAALYEYGDPTIANGKIACIAGGGNSVGFLKEIASEGVNTLVTGISAVNAHSQAAHNFARENLINILGGTHYSTEAGACRALCEYFEVLGLPSRYVDDDPVFEDM